nr:sigma-70 family RNA polymerase sigma factor [uncultured Pseudomonas sp.]
MKLPATHREEIGALFEEHYKWLRHHVSTQIGCHAGGEDIASETFAQILNKPLTTPIREPKAFLATIARRLMYQTWRRRDLERAYLASITEYAEPISITLEEHAQIIETLMTIDRFLSGMAPKVKATFLMSQIEGMTYAQIASELRISERSVSDYMKKAFKRCLTAALGLT